MVSIQFILIFTIISIQIFAAVNTQQSSPQVIITSTSSSDTDTVNCFETNIESNISMYINQCGVYFENCDDECISNIDNFNLCADSCRNQFMNPTKKFDWTCYDICINSVNDVNFRNLAVCVYEPCRTNRNSLGWLLAIIVILAVLIIIGIGFALYRRYNNEKLSERELIQESFTLRTV